VIGKTFVLGFGHKARHGKDSAARYIHEFYPRETRIYSFAGALKAYCRVAYGMTTKDAPLLQRVGLEMREERHPDFWVEILRHQIAEEQPEVALITDVRFPNEVAFCDAAIKVMRWVPTEFGAAPFVAQDRPADHPSEIALDDYTGWFTQINVMDGELHKLQEAAISVYQLARLGVLPKGFPNDRYSRTKEAA
jgi:hypothetical protein